MIGVGLPSTRLLATTGEISGDAIGELGSDAIGKPAVGSVTTFSVAMK